MGARAGVSHAARPELSGREPLLVTLKMGPRVWSLRTRQAFQRLLPALVELAHGEDVRLVHYSIQRDHIHMILEAEGKRSLSRAMRGLTVRIARRLNAMMRRKGPVFADRFHLHVLASPRQVRNALRYVLLNARKHGVDRPERDWIDPYSSAVTFDGWAIRISPGWSSRFAPPVAAPRTWLLRVGWRRAGPAIHPAERPGPFARGSNA